jgi:4-amino-4-deoxy-L-arabinose transferase-like glycosyltransferase
MQTRPRPPAAPPEIESEVENQPAPVSRRGNLVLNKVLNVGIVFAALGLAFVYISRGWEFYDAVPGGRKVIFGMAVATFGGLAAARIWTAFGWQGLRALPLQTTKNSLVREFLPVAGVVVIALGLRIWGVNFGLPYLEHVDEWNTAERAMNMVRTGSLDPHDYQHPGLRPDDRQAFTYPTLTTYMQAGVFSLKFLQGVSAGLYDGTSMLAQPLIKDDFYLWGRAFSAILGALTVLLLYFLARRAYGRGVGLVAAVFLTFFYLHARNSQWLTTDVPSGFMALVPFFFILPILEGKDSRKYYLFAGLFAGLAVATKYNNALILLPLVLAHVLGRPRAHWLNWNLPLAGVAIFAGFFMGAPFVFWHLPQFLNDLGAIVDHYNRGHAGFESDSNWLEYLRYMWLDNAAIVVLALAGIAIGFLRHSKTDIVLLSFPLFTYLQLSSYRVNFSRNLMPVIPFVALFAALALVMLGGWAWRQIGQRAPKAAPYQNVALGLIAVLCIISPALTILRWDAYNAQPTNRARATAWIEQNLPRGAKLWLEPFSTDLLRRDQYRLEGGKSVLDNPPEWYAANGFHYLILSEAYHKDSRDNGNERVKAAYNALIDGPQPAGMSVVADFPRNQTDRPGARIIILQTGVPVQPSTDYVTKNARPLDFLYAGQIKLIGYSVPEKLPPGANFTLNLYWQATRKPDRDFTTFVHVIDKAGKIVAQVDLPPFAGANPTGNWQAGVILRDEYPLALPADLPPGQYRLAAGLYIPNGPRLTLPDGKSQAEVATLEVISKQ